ncbi:MAG: nickel pincer cofactor biosynthesis protein LarC [Lachnospiraceae bacterium]|nr:nickel pincer cofactor biosynthesis protein LarC [Lachnospiraceae bacterium]
MKTLYIDCGMGCAGDMLGAALYELLSEEEQRKILETMNAIVPEGVEVRAERTSRCGIAGTRMRVLIDGEEEESVDAGHAHEHDEHHHHHGHGDAHHGHVHGGDANNPEHAHVHEHDCHDHDDHEHHGHHAHAHDHTHEDEAHHGHTHAHDAHHHHSSMEDIRRIVNAMPVDTQVREDVLAVYALLAEAEAAAHGTEADAVHFHEVGAKDAVADITLVALLLRQLNPARIVASPVNVGGRRVKCAHGILPVPAPATAHLLKNIPSYGGQPQVELCTPTGAALLKHFVQTFSPMPLMRTEQTGYGCGKKEFDSVANLLRVMIGEAEQEEDRVIEFVTNVDDMTPEDAGYATEQLFAAGALEVFTQTIYMKKNRPGLLISVMCRREDRENVLRALFTHTTTLGVREYNSLRHVLTRTVETMETPLGAVRKKVSKGFGVTREKWEHDDLARLAKEQGTSLADIRKQLEA